VGIIRWLCALRSGGRQAGAERSDGAERMAQRRPESSGAQPSPRRKRGAKWRSEIPVRDERERKAANRPPPEGSRAGAWA
jgi:hypothetical protein